MFTRLTALTIAATMFASSVSADLQRLKDTGDCENCDLEGAYLSGARLQIANLEGADLR